MPDFALSYEKVPPEAKEICQLLLKTMAGKVGRPVFLRTLADVIHAFSQFSWLTITIKGETQEMFVDFSCPEQRVYNHFSATCPQSLTLIMAESLQETAEILIIPHCEEYFSNTSCQPIFQQNVVSAISWPLTLNNKVFAVLNLGYENKPTHLDHIASFISFLCSTIAACLGVVLATESTPAGEPGQPEVVADPIFALNLPLEPDFILQSQAMREVIRQVSVLTNLDVPVLLLGETGTGKNMIARYIHNHSLRAKDGQFVRVNCPSVASGLFESEMFGHAKGSFTGATKNRVGRFELAHKGTLFLDEVAELSMDMQSKLLQVLDDSSFERVGESKSIMVDMRIVSATNVHIGEAISQGRLRGDLFHRISVYTIELPPLRQRSEDIPPLVMDLSIKASKKLGLPDLVYTPSVLRALSEYYWPGNTRELSNLITRLVITQNVRGHLNLSLVKSALEQSESYFLAENTPTQPLPGEGQTPKQQTPINVELPEDMSLASMERNHILKVLRQTDGVISGPRGAALILGLPRSTLVHRMQKLGLTPGDKWALNSPDSKE